MAHATPPTHSSHPYPSSELIRHKEPHPHPLLAVSLHSLSSPSESSFHTPTATEGLAPPTGLYQPFYSSGESPSHSTHKSVATSTTAIPPIPPALTISHIPHQSSTQANSFVEYETTTSEDTGWESASMMGLPLTTEEARQDVAVYSKLLQRVNEALGSVEGGNHLSTDMEESLLHKVEEVLSALEIAPHSQKDGGSARRQSQHSETLHFPPYGPSDTSTSTSTSTYDLSHRQLALDLSWADGTYRLDDPSSTLYHRHRATTDRLNRLNNLRTPSNQHTQRPADVLSPLLETSYGGLGDSLLEAGRLANTRRNDVRKREEQRDGVGGMGGAAVDFPRIEYESFVDDDTMAERALAPLLAKYLPRELLNETTAYSPKFASTKPIPTRTHDTHTPSYKDLSPNDGTITMTEQTSLDFEDQLSLASLEYMKRHQLDRGSSLPSNRVDRRAGGGGGGVPNGVESPVVQRVQLGRTMGVARGEPMTRILDVEGIRRLPKLGMQKRY
ncbi:hypothetical protein HK097_007118 [Rhizophlyctis rosea]|uniref:Uncharacterized protein n=1 Tax=Rhizophlyctis rosea TaxID=64517 RepID=A0AAD5SK12_9FUNG|nr:hypothetical protein HK097_007118 [Rhizophlyctis rosea]